MNVRIVRAEPFELPEFHDKTVRPMRDEIRVPPRELAAIDQLVERKARATGRPPKEVRPMVELEVLRYGIEKAQEVSSP